MLSAFRPSDVANIRKSYAQDIIYQIICEASIGCCDIPKVYALRPEQIFVEVIHLIDELKQEQQDIAWRNLYHNIRQDYELLDKTIPQKELDTIAGTIICVLASFLAVSTPYFYHHDLAQMLFLQLHAKDVHPPMEALENMMDIIERHDKRIAQWIDGYMETDEFISDAFEPYFNPTSISDGKQPTHIRFTSTATNDQRAEFKSIMHSIVTREKKRGMAEDIKRFLKNQKMEKVIELIGTETDIWNDLREFFGYPQSYSTFMGANPKLP